MDRGAWWATVHGVTRVGHDLTTKGEEILIVYILLIYTHFFFFLKRIQSEKESKHLNMGDEWESQSDEGLNRPRTGSAPDKLCDSGCIH